MTPRAQLSFLAAGHFACHYFLLIFPTAVIAIEKDWGLGYGAALALGTPLYLAFGLATLPAGWLGDRSDPERMIAIFFVGCGLASLATGFARTEIELMAGLAAIGLFTAIYHPVGIAMITRITQRRGRALAVNGVFGNLGLAAAAIGTGALADGFGWRAAFLVPGVIGLCLGAIYGLCSRHAKRAARRDGWTASPQTVEPVGVPAGMQLRVLAIVLAAALFSGFVFNGVSISLPKLFDERLAAFTSNLTGIGGFSALVFTVAAFAQLPVGMMLDRFGGRMVMLGIFALQAAALALLASATGAATLPTAVIAVTLMFGGIPITSWLVGHYIKSDMRARVFALEYVLSLGMSSVVVPIMAWMYLAGFGFDIQYVLFALSAALVMIVAVALPRGAGQSAPVAG